MSNQLLSSFSFYQFSPGYWGMDAGERKRVRDDLLNALCQSKIHFDLYRSFRCEPKWIFLTWFTVPVEDEQAPANFFQQTGGAVQSFPPFFASC
jgi:hypothetical protein